MLSRRTQPGREAHRSASPVQEIEDAANGFSKELAAFEKTKVQLNVQKKAADTKYAKLKKQLEEVRLLQSLPAGGPYSRAREQDKHSAQQAQSDIRDHTDTLDKLISGKDKFKAELEQEQAALTKVMDGLRGESAGSALSIKA